MDLIMLTAVGNSNQILAPSLVHERGNKYCFILQQFQAVAVKIVNFFILSQFFRYELNRQVVRINFYCYVLKKINKTTIYDRPFTLDFQMFSKVKIMIFFQNELPKSSFLSIDTRTLLHSLTFFSKKLLAFQLNLPSMTPGLLALTSTDWRYS